MAGLKLQYSAIDKLLIPKRPRVSDGVLNCFLACFSRMFQQQEMDSRWSLTKVEGILRPKRYKEIACKLH